MSQVSQNTITAIVAAILGVIIVGGAVFESIAKGAIDSNLVIMASAVLATFFTGQAVRQVNGAKVDALTLAVNGVHARLDAANVQPAKDGTATPPTPGVSA